MFMEQSKYCANDLNVLLRCLEQKWWNEINIEIFGKISNLIAHKLFLIENAWIA